jgi:Leucine-rich repeat (LRR) protein
VIEKAALDTIKEVSLEKALMMDPLKVYKLSLKKMKLTELPEEIYQFKNLQTLDASRNKLIYFPRKMTEFPYLQELDFSNNKIPSIPKELGMLTELKTLILNQNKLAALPPEISNLKKLTFLDVWGNDIGFLPEEIELLSETLKEIDMRVILMSPEEHRKIKELLPKTKIHFSKSCDCGF